MSDPDNIIDFPRPALSWPFTQHALQELRDNAVTQRYGWELDGQTIVGSDGPVTITVDCSGLTRSGMFVVRLQVDGVELASAQAYGVIDAVDTVHAQALKTSAAGVTFLNHAARVLGGGESKPRERGDDRP